MTKSKLMRKQFIHKDEILTGGIRRVILESYLTDLLFADEYSFTLHSNENKKKYKKYLKIADEVTEAFRSLTLKGLVLLSSKYFRLPELYEKIPDFTEGGYEREYSELPVVGSLATDVIGYLGIKTITYGNYKKGYWGKYQYTHLIATFGKCFFGIEPPKSTEKIDAEKYLKLLHGIYTEHLNKQTEERIISATQK